MKYTDILVAVDYSEITENIIKKARIFADDHKANLSLLHIVEPAPNYAFSGGLSNISEVILSQAYEDIAPLCKRYDIKEDNLHIYLSPLRAGILDFIENHHFDLLFMGSHSKTGLSRILSSCTSIIAHTSNCDIYIVRTPET